MNKVRHALIDKAFGVNASLVRELLVAAGKKHQASVDDIVQAGLGHGFGTTSNGTRAAAELKAGGFDFKPLEWDWPWVCPACRKDCAGLVRCGSCRDVSVCSACTTKHGCPACTAKVNARIEHGKRVTAEQEAHRKWMTRQLAQPLPEPEPPPDPSHLPPPPPEPVQTPPDYTEPEPASAPAFMHMGPPIAPRVDEPGEVRLE